MELIEKDFKVECEGNNFTLYYLDAFFPSLRRTTSSL